MYILKHKIKPLSIAIICFSLVLIGIYAVLTSCPYNFRSRTFKGTSNAEDLIALEFSTIDGEISGYGFHLTNSGVENHVNLKGLIDCDSGEFQMDEFLLSNGNLFGSIKGKVDRTKTNVVGGWTNQLGRRHTVVNLEFTEKSPGEVLNTESTRHIKRRAAQQGKRLKQRVLGIFKGFFSSDSKDSN